MSATGGWSCQRCTFYHHVSAQRCAMCQELRISRKQMSDFIRGIPIVDQTVDDGKQKKKSMTNKSSSSTIAPAAAETIAIGLEQPQQNQSTTNRAAATSSFLPSNAAIRDGTLPYQRVHEVTTKSSNQKYSKEQSPAPRSNPQPAQPKRKPLANPYSKKIMATSTTSTASSSASNSVGMRSQTHQMTNTTIHNTQNHRPRPAAASPAVPTEMVPKLTSQEQTSSSTTRTAPRQQTSTGKVLPSASQYPAKINPQKPQRSQLQQQHLKLGQTPMTKPIYTPGPVHLDDECATEWIYPMNELYPRRKYQFEIARTAILHNTLVGLPTGLGKTLIAAVVMYNYYRWFPTGKVVFMAPTLPLVGQQVKACYDIMRIPEQETATLTGKMSPSKRAKVWKDRRAFFCTPQTMEKDIDQGRVDPKLITLIVLDEAHRARGDYSYNKIVQQLENGGAKFRVLGLSATPGSQIKVIQEVVNSLRINKVECRSDEDPDVKQYVHDRQTEVVIVKQRSVCRQIESTINDLLEPHLIRLRREQALSTHGNVTLGQYQILKAKKEYVERSGDHSLNGVFEAVRTFVEMRSTLHQQGIGVVRSKLLRLRDEKKRPGLAAIVKSDPFAKLMELVLQSTCDANSSKATVAGKVMNNPKLQKLQEILIEHFERARLNQASSRAIVFSQYRDSVAEIVDVLNASRPMVRPRHFVGQGKGSGSADTAAASATMNGMKQTEQHQVIKQFRDDVYNVLVCTCK